jgi:hypothetical protein
MSPAQPTLFSFLLASCCCLVGFAWCKGQRGALDCQEILTNLLGFDAKTPLYLKIEKEEVVLKKLSGFKGCKAISSLSTVIGKRTYLFVSTKQFDARAF